MCVIAYKPEGVEMPTFDQLQNGFERNIDGAGFAVVKNGTIYLEKGFFDWYLYRDAIQDYDIQKEDIAVFHCRLATQGDVSVGNTQPFPITAEDHTLGHMSVETQGSIFAHNGSFQTMGHDQLSDSAVFVKQFLANAVDKILDNDVIAKMYDTYVNGSKTIIIRADKTVHLSGNWITKDGVKWSNANYQPCVPNSMGFGGFNNKKHTYNNKMNYSNLYSLQCPTCFYTCFSTAQHEKCRLCTDWMVDVTEDSSEPEPLVCVVCGMAYTGNVREHACDDCGGLLVKESEYDGGDEDDDEDVDDMNDFEIQKYTKICIDCGTRQTENVPNGICTKCDGVLAQIPTLQEKGESSHETEIIGHS